MDTYYARHRIAIDPATYERIWNQRRVAIHYPEMPDGALGTEDSESLDPRDYSKGAKRAVRALAKLAGNGGYVCAEYHTRNDCLVGQVQPGSQIEIIYGIWSRETKPGRKAALKSLKLRETRIIKPADYAPIVVGRPRQGTLQRWKKAGKLIECLVEDRPLEDSLDSLSPTQQEVLCSEFLRSPTARQYGLPNVAHLLLPVGRTLKDIDILGVTHSGERVFAQVTHHPLSQALGKLDRLQRYRADTGVHLVLFCQADHPAMRDGVFVFPLGLVFSEFTLTDSGRTWLRAGFTGLPESAA